jgi:clan AA aspartic protease (TIGR02281 family)
MSWIVRCKFEDLAFAIWSSSGTQGLINIRKGSVVHFDARTICASQNCQLFPTEFALQNVRPDTPAELPKGAPQSSGETSAAAPKEEPFEAADNLVALESQGGAYVVPVLINNAITLNFVVDSGASDVTIPADVVMTLVRTGTLKEEDFIGSKTYTLADGSTVPSATFRIKSLKVGNRMIDDVTAGIAPIQGNLLLGQSFLNKFNSWSIDNTKHVLILR